MITIEEKWTEFHQITLISLWVVNYQIYSVYIDIYVKKKCLPVSTKFPVSIGQWLYCSA